PVAPTGSRWTVIRSPLGSRRCRCAPISRRQSTKSWSWSCTRNSRAYAAARSFEPSSDPGGLYVATKLEGSHQAQATRGRGKEPRLQLRQIRRRTPRAWLRHHRGQLATAHPVVFASGGGDRLGAYQGGSARVLDGSRGPRGRDG